MPQKLTFDVVYVLRILLECSETPLVNINDVSVRETKEKSDNPALWKKIVLYSAFLENILFWDERSGW